MIISAIFFLKDCVDFIYLRPSSSMNDPVCLFPSSYYLEIFRSYYQCRSDADVNDQGQGSKVMVPEVKTPFSHLAVSGL